MARKKYSFTGPEGTDLRRARKGFSHTGEVRCPSCIVLQRRNDELRAEVARLKSQLRQFEAPALDSSPAGPNDFLNTPHIPSSKIAYKRNATDENKGKRGGAKKGHLGSGRVSASSSDVIPENVIDLEIPGNKCPECESPLWQRDVRERTVIDTPQIKAEQFVYRCRRGQCPKCNKVFMPKPPVLPKTLYGNSLIAQAAATHYLYGLSIGRVVELLGDQVTEGGLINCFHRLGRLFDQGFDRLIREYRQSPVKHADETGWRTDGSSGYAWLFCTKDTSIFDFRNTRSARVAREVFGTAPLKGVLVVDRYGGYNKAPCELQYCFAHLLREVKKTENDFQENAEVKQFTGSLGHLLSECMKLRNRDISDREYVDRAQALKREIEIRVERPARHLAIQRIQHLFKKNKHRLYHWVGNREIPAENNRAEREIRPTVIARKVSFGSQSEQGARTRSRIMSVFYTVRKRLNDKPMEVEVWLKKALDQLARDPHFDWYSFLPKPSN